VPTYSDLRLNKVTRHGKASTVPTGTKKADKMPDIKEHHHNATDLTGKTRCLTTKKVSQNPAAYKQALTPYHPKMVGTVSERQEAYSGAVRSLGGLNNTVLKRMTNGHATSAKPNPLSVCESLETAVFIFLFERQQRQEVAAYRYSAKYRFGLARGGLAWLVSLAGRIRLFFAQVQAILWPIRWPIP